MGGTVGADAYARQERETHRVCRASEMAAMREIVAMRAERVEMLEELVALRRQLSEIQLPPVKGAARSPSASPAACVLDGPLKTSIPLPHVCAASVGVFDAEEARQEETKVHHHLLERYSAIVHELSCCRIDLEEKCEQEVLLRQHLALAKSLAHGRSRIGRTTQLLQLEGAMRRWMLTLPRRDRPFIQAYVGKGEQSAHSMLQVLRRRVLRKEVANHALRWADRQKYGVLLRWRSCAFPATRGGHLDVYTSRSRSSRNEEVLRDLLREVVVMKAAVSAVI